MDRYLVLEVAPDALQTALNSRGYKLHSVLPVIVNGATAHFLIVFERF